MVLVQTGSETILGNLGMLETKWSGVFGKIPNLDWDCRVWSSPDQVPISPGPNFPNTSTYKARPHGISYESTGQERLSKYMRNVIEDECPGRGILMY